MVDGEMLGTGGITCSGEVGHTHSPIKLPLRVCHSAAGYYLGYWCPHCGPVSRETHYYLQMAHALHDLENDPTARCRTKPEKVFVTA